MNGKGVIRGLGVVVRHFFDTYIVDIQARLAGRKRYFTEEGVKERASHKARGIFTVQYPEEKLPVPEEFRFIPFLVYEEKEDGLIEYRCTSCGICSKVCPPQCIWIIRSTDPETGRPIPDPREFTIDADICMGCGLCAEYCPFDAIKMDHDYELANYDRFSNSIYNKKKLGKPVSYYSQVRPLSYGREEAARIEAEAMRAARRPKA